MAGGQPNCPKLHPVCKPPAGLVDPRPLSHRKFRHHRPQSHPQSNSIFRHRLFPRLFWRCSLVDLFSQHRIVEPLGQSLTNVWGGATSRRLDPLDRQRIDQPCRTRAEAIVREPDCRQLGAYVPAGQDTNVRCPALEGSPSTFKRQHTRGPPIRSHQLSPKVGSGPSTTARARGHRHCVLNRRRLRPGCSLDGPASVPIQPPVEDEGRWTFILWTERAT